MSHLRLIGIAFVAALLGGCATHTAYRGAFSDSLVSGVARRIEAPFAPTFEVVKLMLVQRGFNVEAADSTGGLIRASRSLDDKRDSTLSYSIHATLSVSGLGPTASAVAIAATQQTIKHSSSRQWSSLLGIVPVPLPGGKTYSATVIKEGAIDDPRLYADFFAALEHVLAAPRPVAATIDRCGLDRCGTGPSGAAIAVLASSTSPARN